MKTSILFPPQPPVQSVQWWYRRWSLLQPYLGCNNDNGRTDNNNDDHTDNNDNGHNCHKRTTTTITDNDGGHLALPGDMTTTTAITMKTISTMTTMTKATRTEMATMTMTATMTTTACVQWHIDGTTSSSPATVMDDDNDLCCQLALHPAPLHLSHIDNDHNTLSCTKHVWYSEHGMYCRFEIILERAMSVTHVAVIPCTRTHSDEEEFPKKWRSWGERWLPDV